MSARFRLGTRDIGPDEPTYFIADVAANHDGDLARALELIELAAQSGADAAKFQNFRAETIVSERGFSDLHGRLSHQRSWTKPVVEVYRDASIPEDWTVTLADACRRAGIDYFTSPYDLELIPALEPHVCAWKVGSGDITWHEAIELMARSGKPVLLATGASTLDEVRAAVDVVRRYTTNMVIMQCNTNYTVSRENFRNIELRVLETYAREFPDTCLGLSDHTQGPTTVLGAVALGARVIERHFTDDRSRPGPDHPFSTTPAEWRQMVDWTRELEDALGDGHKRVMPNEVDARIVQRRAIRLAHDLEAGTSLRADDLVFLRPCPEGSLEPTSAAVVVGRVLTRSMSAGEALTWQDLSAAGQS